MRQSTELNGNEGNIALISINIVFTINQLSIELCIFEH